MKKPRFILLTPVLPWPANQGNRLFLLDVARRLKDHGEVAWITRCIGDQSEGIARLVQEGFHLHLDHSFQPQDPLHRIRRRLQIDWTAYRKGCTREEVFCNSPEMARLAGNLKRDWPDAFGVGVFWYMWPTLVQFPPGKRILILSDIESDRARKGRLAGDGTIDIQTIRRLEKGEIQASLSSRNIFCLTGEDCTILKKMLQDAAVHPFPETGVWPMGLQGEADVPDRPAGNSHEDFLIYGHWEAAFNHDGLVHWLREIWPSLKEQDPSLRIRIAGAGLEGSLRRELEESGIQVLGWVEDLQQEIRRCRGVLIPLRYAGGLRIRLLECMLAGRPVVCTEMAALGSGARPGQHYIQADTPREWRKALVDLGDDDYARRLTEAASAFVLENYGIEARIVKVGRILEDLIRREREASD